MADQAIYRHLHRTFGTPTPDLNLNTEIYEYSFDDMPVMLTNANGQFSYVF